MRLMCSLAPELAARRLALRPEADGTFTLVAATGGDGAAPRIDQTAASAPALQTDNSGAAPLAPAMARPPPPGFSQRLAPPLPPLPPLEPSLVINAASAVACSGPSFPELPAAASGLLVGEPLAGGADGFASAREGRRLYERVSAAAQAVAPSSVSPIGAPCEETGGILASVPVVARTEACAAPPTQAFPSARTGRPLPLPRVTVKQPPIPDKVDDMGDSCPFEALVTRLLE